MKLIKVGEKYGRLTVLENHHPKDEVVCKCECGKTKVSRASNVYYGGTRSCGCLKNPGNTKHGGSGTRLYMIWKSMHERCTAPSQNSYKNYGGKGIKVCKEWDDFLVFKEWALSHDYRDDLTIDRINVNGNYEPTNCRWVTAKVQSNNRTTNHYLIINGERRTVSEWSDISGIRQSTISARLKMGWGEEDAVFHPLIPHGYSKEVRT